MTEILKAAFIFVAPESDPAEQQAVATCKELVQSENIKAIELCGGFGNQGTARIAEAVGSDVAVGVVRFDVHPGLNNVSGDKLFI